MQLLRTQLAITFQNQGMLNFYYAFKTSPTGDLKANLQAATDVYIQGCNHAPCGDAQIVLFNGSDLQEIDRDEKI